MTTNSEFSWSDAFREAYSGTGGGYKALAADLEAGLQAGKKMMAGHYDPPEDRIDAALLALREKLIGKATKILRLLGDVEARLETLNHENNSSPRGLAAEGRFSIRHEACRGNRFGSPLAEEG